MKHLLFCLASFILFSFYLHAELESPLSFQLVSFNAESADEAVQIKWVTENEIDVNCFIIERSADAVTFDSITTVSSKGAGSWQNSYMFSDSPPTSGLYYYRLKQRGITPGFKLSPVICVNYENAEPSVSLYPNPSNGLFTLNYNLNGEDKAVFTIHSLRGRKIAVYNIDPMKSSLLISIDLDKGIYYGDVNISNKSSRRFKIIIN